MSDPTISPPGVGETAPDFTLPSTAGVDVTLSALRGQRNVLLAFFPLAFTSTCTAENRAFTEDYDQFAGPDTVVLPISVDSVPTLKEYRTKYVVRWLHTEAKLGDRRDDAELLRVIRWL